MARLVRFAALLVCLSLASTIAAIPAGSESVSVSVGIIPIDTEVGVWPTRIPARSVAGVFVVVRNSTDATLRSVVVELDVPPTLVRSPVRPIELGPLRAMQEVSHYWAVCPTVRGRFVMTARYRVSGAVFYSRPLTLDATEPQRRALCSP